MPVDVLFSDARSRNTKDSLILKLGRIFDRMKLEKRISGKTVAIKTHFGSLYCTRYLRPHYLRMVVDKVKEVGGDPFVTDTTTLDLANERGTAAKYIETARLHGFTHSTLNAPIIIADGLLGNEHVSEEIDGYQLKRVYLAKDIYEADFLLNVVHFKGHGLTGIGGACKNISLGCSSKLGKNHAHFYTILKVNKDKCNGCGDCVSACPVKAITIVKDKAVIDENLCFACRECKKICKLKAINNERVTKEDFNIRVADTTHGLMKLIGDKNTAFINIIIDVDWLCDCEHLQQGWSDLHIVPDIGITASYDPVAIDQASTDLVNEAKGIPGSKAEEAGALKSRTDKFKIINGISPNVHLKLTEKHNVGTRNYNLVKIE